MYITEAIISERYAKGQIHSSETPTLASYNLPEFQFNCTISTEPAELYIFFPQKRIKPDSNTTLLFYTTTLEFASSSRQRIPVLLRQQQKTQ